MVTLESGKEALCAKEEPVVCRQWVQWQMWEECGGATMFREMAVQEQWAVRGLVGEIGEVVSVGILS